MHKCTLFLRVPLLLSLTLFNGVVANGSSESLKEQAQQQSDSNRATRVLGGLAVGAAAVLTYKNPLQAKRLVVASLKILGLVGLGGAASPLLAACGGAGATLVAKTCTPASYTSRKKESVKDLLTEEGRLVGVGVSAGAVLLALYNYVLL